MHREINFYHWLFDPARFQKMDATSWLIWRIHTIAFVGSFVKLFPLASQAAPHSLHGACAETYRLAECG